MSFFHLISLPSSFVLLPVPFSPSFSFRYIYSTCTLLSLSLHSSFCTFFPLLPSNTYFLSPHSHAHHFSLSCILSPQGLRNFLCNIPLILPVVSGFFDSLPSFLLVCVFVPFTRLYIATSFHFFTGIPVPLVVLLRVLFLSSPASVSILHSSLPSNLSSNFAALFPAFSLSSLFHPQISAPYINILCIMLVVLVGYYLICFPHYLSDMCLIPESSLIILDKF
jgi:hypothetical protein